MGRLARVLVTGFPSAVFGTNCFVLATGPGQECLVVDPGIEVVDTLADVLAEYHLRPAAVLLTHGHIDHTYSVTPVCGAHGVPALIHGDDAYRVTDALASVSPGLLQMFEREFGRRATWQDPDEVRQVVDGELLSLAGLDVRVLHAPGHTEGSVMFSLDAVPDGSDAGATLLSGDVLFAGSIGRTDLPGGDHAAMLRSLRDKVLTLSDDTLVLPGHGNVTSIGRERATNAYLLEVAGA